LSYPHSYQSIPLLSEIPDNNSVLLKYATTRATVDQGTAHKLRPRLFPHFCCQIQGNSAPAPHVPDSAPDKAILNEIKSKFIAK